MSDALPAHYNFAHDVIERQGRERPDALALWWVSELDASERKLSFGQLSDELRRASAFFAAQGIARSAARELLGPLLDTACARLGFVLRRAFDIASERQHLLRGPLRRP